MATRLWLPNTMQRSAERPSPRGSPDATAFAGQSLCLHIGSSDPLLWLPQLALGKLWEHSAALPRRRRGSLSANGCARGPRCGVGLGSIGGNSSHTGPLIFHYRPLTCHKSLGATLPASSRQVTSGPGKRGRRIYDFTDHQVVGGLLVAAVVAISGLLAGREFKSASGTDTTAAATSTNPPRSDYLACHDHSALADHCGPGAINLCVLVSRNNSGARRLGGNGYCATGISPTPGLLQQRRPRPANECAPYSGRQRDVEHHCARASG